MGQRIAGTLTAPSCRAPANLLRESAAARRIAAAGWLAIVLTGGIECLADQLVYDTPNGRQTVEGQLTARTASEVLFLARDGRMHLVNTNRIVQLDETEEKPTPLTKEEAMAALRREFGGHFRVFSTRRYIICYNSDRGFAQSCGNLFENLHRSFTNYFERQAGFQLQPSQYPLVAIVFGNERDFLAYAESELGEEMARNVIGYYSFLTNRMVMYDMLAGAGRRGLGNVGANRPAPTPQGIGAFNPSNVATIIHEATHQLAYNSGFHQRFSDNPLWLAEGMAMFFEVSNRSSGGFGEINRPRFDLFRKEHISPGTKPFSIEVLVKNDERLRNKDTALAAYADAWALTYFLLKTRREQFYDYLRILAKKPPLSQDTPDQRLADFKTAFGANIAALEDDVMRYMRALPAR